ncbi:hypothetical protein scyTo_0023222, partial [Scyliorhinus torazame]|nr:hypothetical protein [Scyliorhinus torazame]
RGEFPGEISGARGEFPGAISGARGDFPGAISAARGECPGEVSAARGECPGEVSAARGEFPGDVSAARGEFPGEVSAAELSGAAVVELQQGVAVKRKISLSGCEACGAFEAKYRCPRCMTHSCRYKTNLQYIFIKR